jgi:DNA primase/predicted transcriptional regulator
MELTRIKTRLSIAAVLEHYGLTPDRSHRLCCPFHPDRNPSLQIYPGTNTYCCFSANCTAGTGDQIQFIELMEKCSKHDAILKAESMLSPQGEIPQGGKALLKATALITGNTPAMVQPASKLFIEADLMAREAVLTKLFTYFKKALPLTKKAVDYLQNRSLNYKLHEAGYNSGDWHHKLSEKHFLQSAEQCGLLKAKPAGGYTTWAKDCVIFPLKNAEGKIISLYGRSTTNDKEQRHFYLQNRSGLYPSYPALSTSKLILTESIIDAASLLEQPSIKEHYSVLALYGTNGFTEEHLKAIAGLPQLEEIIFMLNGDEAGEAATRKHYSTLKELLPEVKLTHAILPQGEDVNSVLQGHDDGSVLAHLVETRIDFSFSIEKENEQAKSLAPSALQSNTKLITHNPELLIYNNCELYMEVLGGIKITGLDRMKVTLKVRHKERLHNPQWYSLDLYSQVQREQTITELKKTNLIERTSQLLQQCGIIGEETNSLIAYLVYTVRKQPIPLHVMFLGSSGSGKTYLQERVSELMPEEDKIEITQITENALYYFKQQELKNKLILIEDLDGAQSVFYPLRELQTKRKISKTVTLKDSKGNLKTITLTVEGPVCVSGCTTKEKIYEDNANRCLLLYTDQSRDQDKRINEYQARLAGGEVNRGREEQYKELFKNMQRLLQPITIINPYAKYIELPEQVFKPRRTMTLLLGFIEAITFYHQYQREMKKDSAGGLYIETTIEDIEAAFTLLKDVLFSKSDELTKATRSFFEQLKQLCKETSSETFQAKGVREQLRINPGNMKRYLAELVRYGYIKANGNRYRKGSYEYSIVNPQEYEALKSSVEQHLQAVLDNIRKGAQVVQ